MHFSFCSRFLRMRLSLSAFACRRQVPCLCLPEASAVPLPAGGHARAKARHANPCLELILLVPDLQSFSLLRVVAIVLVRRTNGVALSVEQIHFYRNEFVPDLYLLCKYQLLHLFLAQLCPWNKSISKAN
jgi:hypothetical protein